RFSTYQVGGEAGVSDVALPPEEFNRLASAVSEKLAKAGENGIFPVIATSGRRRRFLQMALSAKGIAAPVLSFEEIGTNTRPALVGMVAA
ncbi:flagellar biosynthesis protein FlhA, partial [Rhodovulum sulfidophilum]|nr:flagellar biosynthesis protein FlhA [Rhodovulum sulfidophilum]